MDSLDHGTLHKAKARTLDTSKRTNLQKKFCISSNGSTSFRQEDV